jgi:hypothetical protein|tara:strand:+ start:41 stop:1174 length:1134 start_codon:yes stop_codon:yes gene_type:complete
MADTLYFSRDTKVFIEIGNNVWEIPVLDGFSFSQATNTSEITLNEMADGSGNSRRGRRMFNDSYAPAEWSFSTYMRPFASAGSDTAGNASRNGTADIHAVEEALWALMVGDASHTATSSSQAANFTGFTYDATDLDITFANSNKTTLGTANFYFQLGGATSGNKSTYKIEGCVVNEASMDFDIDGIATINWSGFGKIISEATVPGTITYSEKIDATTNFIRNRLTHLQITTSDGTAGSNTHPSEYDLVLTGGNVTISNNITFLTPETLGVVNQPIGHVTGTRSVSGNFTCYLNNEDNSSAELFENLIEDTASITNDFELKFFVGGETATPRVELDMQACHLEIPTHSMDDIISVETNFHALPSTIEGTDELTIKYVA